MLKSIHEWDVSVQLWYPRMQMFYITVTRDLLRRWIAVRLRSHTRKKTHSHSLENTPGTALGVIYESHDQKKNIHVWVDETRPRLQGARLTAWELMRYGVRGARARSARIYMIPVITRMSICITQIIYITHLYHKKISRKATLKRTLKIL